MKNIAIGYEIYFIAIVGWRSVQHYDLQLIDI